MAKETKRHLFSRFSLAWTRLFSTSFFAFFLSLYSRANARFLEGIFHRIHKAITRNKRPFVKFKQAFARQIEGSFITGLFKKCLHYLLSIRLKSVALFCFTVGFCNCLNFLARRFLPLNATADTQNLFFGLCLMLASLPLFARRRSLFTALRQSRFAGTFLTEAALFREAEYPILHAHSADAFCLPAGILVGVACAFASPFALLFGLFVIVFAALSLYKPEFGASLSLFCLPFLDAKSATALVLFVLFCLFFKALRGRRSLHFELICLVCALFAAFLFFAGRFSVLPANDHGETLVLAVLSFFLYFNLSRRRAVFSAALAATVLGGALCSAFHLLATFLPEAAVTGSARSFLRTLTAEASPVFCVTASVLALYFILRARRGGSRLLAFVALALLITDLWVYSSLSATIAAALCCMILLAVSSRAWFFAVLFLSGATLIALPLIEGAQTAFLWEALEARAPSLLSAQSALPQGSFVFGIGAFSPDALTSLNLPESLSGNLTLYTQLLLAVGIVGVLLLALFLVFAFQKAADYYLSSAYNTSRLLVIAPIVAVCSLLLYGLTQNLMLDARSFSLLFSFCGISAASVNALASEDAVLLEHF